MNPNPLLEKLRTKDASIGLYVESAEMVELCAHLGFDWFAIDQMFTAADWSRTEGLIRAGEAYGITPVVRLQSNPWLGHDDRIAVDAGRAQGIGAQFILVSHSDVDEIRKCMTVSRDWHRKLFTVHPFDSLDEWTDSRFGTDQETVIIPQPETRSALDSLEEIMQLDGVRVVFIAMTDASRVLSGGARPDWYHPAVWEYVDAAIELGERYGVQVGANTSYAYDLAEIEDRVGVLKDRGVRMILIQGAMFLFQIAVGGMVKRIKSRIL